VASFRAQERLLDRLSYCVDSSLSRRRCLHNLVVGGERETMRRWR
jgi:hypothetical protein